MFRPLLCIFNLLYVFVVVNGHSLLRTPTAWANRESKRAPCGNGNGNIPTTVVNTADPGAQIAGMWEVTAGDGNGPVTITMVTTNAAVTTTGFGAGTVLPINMPIVPQSGTGRYDFTFNAPLVDVCKGDPGGNTCHLQFKSTSNWYSCMSLTVNTPPAPTSSPIPAMTPAPTPPPTLPPPAENCVKALVTNPGICAGADVGVSVLVPVGSTVSDLVTLADNSFTLNRYNPLVFRNGISQACGNALAQYFCSDNMNRCNEADPRPSKIGGQCKTRCEAAMSLCDLDPLHNGAFKCSDLVETSSDVYGTCPTVPTRVVNLKSRVVGVSPNFWAPSETYLGMSLYKGDKLTFNYAANDYVNRYSSEESLKNCMVSASTRVEESESGKVEWTVPDAGEFTDTTFYFGGSGCSPDGTLTGEHKLVVTIVDIPAGAQVVALASDADPEVIPESPPTASPGGFIPDPVLDDSAALPTNVMSFVIFMSVLLKLFL